MKLRFTFAALFITTFFRVHAQPFQMRLVDKGSNLLGLQMRVTGGTVPTTTHFVSDLKWGVRWLASTNVNLGSLVQNPTGTYHVTKSATEITKTVSGTTYEFQSLSIITSPYNFPTNWVLNTWVDIVALPVSGNVPSVNFEICPTGFDGTTNRNFTFDLDDHTPDIESNATVVLPLELIRFTAKNAGNQRILLNWETVSERNMTHFELEKSQEGHHFTPLSIIKAKNGAQQTYSFEDPNPYAHLNYYRLKMVNLDGSFTYSSIQSVVENTTKPLLSISPNPVKSGTRLHIKVSNDTPSDLTLTDLSGKIMLQTTFKNDVWLPTEGVASGLYLLTWRTANQRETVKIFIE